ncbi:MAG: CCA tRNA nucleotidyltransferase [bacterium]|nr:CCA tRNA nucleotidyltransferase [bacterium]
MGKRIKIDTHLDHFITQEERELIHMIQEVAESTRTQVRIVGGFVRDRLMQKFFNTQIVYKPEIDFVTDTSAIDLAKRVSKILNDSIMYQYGHFGTARVEWKNWQLEFAQARKESYSIDSRNPIVTPATFEEDLARRDFTVNALAWGITQKSYGELYDLFNGVKDLQNRTLRTPLDPVKTFSDDPLRLMRAVRFAAKLSFEIEPTTLEGMKQSAERIQIVHQERITEEFLQLMKSPKPSLGLQILFQTGILHFIIPELVELKGVDQKGQHGHKDVWEHTLKVLENASEMTDDITIRLAALFHDIAKPKTKKYIPEQGWTFYGHEILGAKMITRIFQRLKIPTHITKKVSQMTALHMRPVALVQEGVTDSAVRRLRVNAGEDLEKLLILCRADITSKNPQKVKTYLENYQHMKARIELVEKRDKLQAFQSPIRGNEIAEIFQIPFGPKIGQIKAAIENAILDGIIPNEYDAAKNWLMQNKDWLMKLPEKQLKKRSLEDLTEEQLQRALQNKKDCEEIDNGNS